MCSCTTFGMVATVVLLSGGPARARGAGGEEGIDLGLPEAGFAQDLEAVLAEPRRQPANRARRLAVGGGDAGQPHGALGRVLDDLPEAGGLELGIVRERMQRVRAHGRGV